MMGLDKPGLPQNVVGAKLNPYQSRVSRKSAETLAFHLLAVKSFFDLGVSTKLNARLI